MKLEAQMNLTLQRPKRHSVLERNPISLSQTGRRGEEGGGGSVHPVGEDVCKGDAGGKPNQLSLRCLAQGEGEQTEEREHVRGVKAPQQLSVCLFSCSVPQPEA